MTVTNRNLLRATIIYELTNKLCQLSATSSRIRVEGADVGYSLEYCRIFNQYHMTLCFEYWKSIVARSIFVDNQTYIYIDNNKFTAYDDHMLGE